MRENIISTLRDKLFEHPAPAQREALFQELAGEMFPGRASFITFLEERQTEAQIEAAKQVLLRLGYEARIFPPNKLIFKLLEVECLLAGTTTKGPFYGRDHFVHLVNLYLLGLYVFWYHADLHHKIVEQFKRLTSALVPRADQHRDPREGKRTAVRTFIAAWRDFVIFHDLGYPWEANPTMEEGARYLEAFRDLLRYAAKDESLFALSHLIAFEWLRLEDAPLLGNELAAAVPSLAPIAPAERDPLLNLEFGDSQNEAWGRSGLPSRLLKAQRLPNSGDPSIMRFVRVFVPEGDLIPILESTAEDLPMASTNLAINERLHGLKDTDLGELSRPEVLARHALTTSLPPKLRVAYRWVYYAVSLDEHFERLLDALFPTGGHAGERSSAHFLGFARDFIRKTPLLRPDGVDPCFTDHAFCVFQNLLGSLDFDYLDETPPPAPFFLKDHLIDESRRGLEKIFHSEAARLLGGQLEQHARKLKDDQNLIRPEPDWTAFRGTSLAVSVDGLLKRRHLDGVDTLARYHPGFFPSSSAATSATPHFADHGLASGLLYADLQRMCDSFAQSTPSMLLRLLNLRGGNAAWHLVDPATPSPATAEVGYTIFVHNLYPRDFANPEHRKFRTRPERDQAFTFLALLCDSLQPWDRKRLFNQGTDTLPYSTYAEDFNFVIREGFFYITEHGNELRLEERTRALRQHLDQFL